ncbi:MAG: DegT/DnrJ/EryC1/StrS family aminotransferase [bacterium]|nr:DegT/DnrJ/EryC1/StrS family aminotransferase [bacterium]
MVISPVHFPFWPRKQKTDGGNLFDFGDIFYFQRGSLALAEGLMAILRKRKKEKLQVLFPDYFCKEPLEVLKSFPISIIFYPIQKNFEPDWEKVKIIFQTKQPDAFVLVHYFGFPNNLEKAQEICDECNVALVEDCAHVLRPSGKVGRTGIFSIFSPWKFLSLNDLGLLKTKNQLAPFVQLSKNYFAVLPFLKWVFKKKVQQILCFLNVNWYKQKRKNSFEDFDDLLSVNSWSVKLFNIYSRGIDSIINQRRKNYLFLESSTKKNYLNGLIRDELLEEVVPYIFPLVCKKPAERYIKQLVQKGVPASSWPDLPEEVKNNPLDYPWANFYAEYILLFPIHQDITERGMQYMEKQIANVLYAQD